MAGLKLLNFRETKDALEIAPSTDPEAFADLQECKDIYDAMEWQLCNGWSIVPPEMIGALTDGMILCADIEYSEEDGRINGMGPCYWDEQYQVRDALEKLKAGETIRFLRRD